MENNVFSKNNNLLKKTMFNMFIKARDLNGKNILSLLEKNSDAKLLDLGCDDGKWTMQVCDVIGTNKVYAIEIIKKRADLAEKKGIKIKIGNLNSKFPFKSNTFDVIHANQVIEHIGNLDSFLDEIYRVLKPNGYVIISTENASSWHNIFASLFGWQIFSLTNLSSKKAGLGNPLAMHRNEIGKISSWTHKTIFSYYGLKEFFEVHSFKVSNLIGAGYYPLPEKIGQIDGLHAHFITIKARK